MAILTGAIPKIITRHDTPMARWDAVVNHIAVSNGASLHGYFNQPGNPTSHFYVRRSGPQGADAGMADFEQYVDTRFRAPAQLQGNHRCISIETQGGVGSDLDNGWTVAQVNRLAWIAAECNRLHDIPLALMPNSLPSSRGIGYHRLGVDPYRVSGGELWSESFGKVCPGSARVAQIPTIITLARRYAAGGDDGTMAWTDADIAAVRAYLKTISEESLEMTSLFRTHSVRMDNLVNKQLPDARGVLDQILDNVYKTQVRTGPAQSAQIELATNAALHMRDVLDAVKEEVALGNSLAAGSQTALLSLGKSATAVESDVDAIRDAGPAPDNDTPS